MNYVTQKCPTIKIYGCWSKKEMKSELFFPSLQNPAIYYKRMVFKRFLCAILKWIPKIIIGFTADRMNEWISECHLRKKLQEKLCSIHIFDKELSASKGKAVVGKYQGPKALIYLLVYTNKIYVVSKKEFWIGIGGPCIGL